MNEFREGPPIKYVPVLRSLADHQRNPGGQFLLGYVRADEHPEFDGAQRLYAQDGPAEPPKRLDLPVVFL